MEEILARINATYWLHDAVHCAFGVIVLTTSDRYTGDLLADIGIPADAVYTRYGQADYLTKQTKQTKENNMSETKYETINEPCVNLTLPNGEVVRVRGDAETASKRIMLALDIPVKTFASTGEH